MTTFMLKVQVVCMCILSYGSISAELSIIFLEQVLVTFVFGWRQNVAKYGHVWNLVVWTT